MTPNLAVIRIQSEHAWCPPIPLPLFLLWIPGILLAPFVLLAIWSFAWCSTSVLANAGVLWDLLCALPGTHVRVCAERKKITVRIL